MNCLGHTRRTGLEEQTPLAMVDRGSPLWLVPGGETGGPEAGPDSDFVATQV